MRPVSPPALAGPRIALPWGALAALALVACEAEGFSSRPAAVDARARSVARPAAPRPRHPGVRPEPRRGPPRRIVAFGDLHGDLDAARRVLRLAGAIDGSERWIGGRLVVVQVGDQIDRGPDDRGVLDLFDRLREPARRAGGAVHALIGNHELMNVRGRLHHVSRKAWQSFAEFAPSGAAAKAYEKLMPLSRGRIAAFRPGGVYARRLARRPVILKVERNIFVHAGLAPEHAHFGLERLNLAVRRYLQGERKELPRAVWDRTGIVWTRYLGRTPVAPRSCKRLGEALALLGADRVVVGHSRQERINAACGGRVWRTDVSLSAYYGRRPVQALELIGAGARVLVEKRHGADQPTR